MTRRAILLGLLASAACAPSTVVRDALATNNPGGHRAVTGVPPVPPESLSIVPTGMSPVSTAAVRPDPILPAMDETFENRHLPPGTEPRPARRPRGHEGWPEGLYQPEDDEAGADGE